MTPEKKREWRQRNHDDQLEKARARFRKKNTEEYRAERRRKYAEKHKDDPMTDHRRRCIAAAEERMRTPLADRRAEKAAKADIQKTLAQAEEESVRERETVIKYIDQWTRRKRIGFTPLKDGELMSEADVQAYYKEAHKYFRLQKQMEETDPRDYNTRNILAYKMRVIESHFNDLLNKRINTKNKLKAE